MSYLSKNNLLNRFPSKSHYHREIFFFKAEDGIRDDLVTGVQTCALPISLLREESRRRLLAARLDALYGGVEPRADGDETDADDHDGGQKLRQGETTLVG